MTASQLINQDSGSVEYYTPPEIIEAARATMGSIDTDPFSCEIANRTVKAAIIFTKEDGESTFNLEWHGNIWMNHPFSRAMNKRCIEKLIHEFCKCQSDLKLSSLSRKQWRRYAFVESKKQTPAATIK